MLLCIKVFSLGENTLHMLCVNQLFNCLLLILIIILTFPVDVLLWCTDVANCENLALPRVYFLNTEKVNSNSLYVPDVYVWHVTGDCVFVYFSINQFY